MQVWPRGQACEGLSTRQADRITHRMMTISNEAERRQERDAGTWSRRGGGAQGTRLRVHVSQVGGSYALVRDLGSLQLKKKDEPEIEEPAQTSFKSPKSLTGLR